MNAEIPQEKGIRTDVGYQRPPKEHQFKKGQIPNPGGRPKGRAITRLMRKMMKEMNLCLEEPTDKTNGDKTLGEELVAAYFRKAIKGSAAHGQEIIERIEGKVPDRMEFQEVNKGYDVDNVPDDL